MIEIKPYGPEWENAHSDFALRHWTKTRRRIPSYIYWKFRSKPGVSTHSFLLAVDGSKVIGQFGVIPVWLQVEGERIAAQWACDLMIDPEYRGQGVAQLLYEAAHANCPITLGSDPSPSASKSMKRMGYQSLSGGFKYVFPYRLGDLLRYKKKSIPVLNWIPHPFLVAVRLFSIFNRSLYQEISPNQYTSHKTSFDLSVVGIEQDDSFVAWRYPSFENYYSGVKCFSTNSGQTFSGYFQNDRFYVASYTAQTYKELWKMLQHLLLLKSNSQGSIRILASNHLVDKRLRRLGFIRFGTPTEIIFYTADLSLKKLLLTKTFFYTYIDSDENI